jgi:prepilin peptidase CpaA
MLGVFFDWKFYKIPNVLCCVIALTGIFFSYLGTGMLGVLYSISGMICPIVLLYILYYCGVLGAGDIKLMSSIGAFYQTSIWKVILLSFLVNGVFAYIKMIKNSSFEIRFNYIKGYLRDCLLAGKPLRDYQSGTDAKIHFSIGILIALIIMHIF